MAKMRKKGRGLVIKRDADRQVAYGNNITGAEYFYRLLKEKQLNVRPLLVNDKEKDFSNVLTTLSPKSLAGTMKIYQTFFLKSSAFCIFFIKSQAIIVLKSMLSVEPVSCRPNFGSPQRKIGTGCALDYSFNSITLAITLHFSRL